MMRRNPPDGYVYVDALAPLYRKPVEWAREWAAAGALKTAKEWSYVVDRGEGEKRTYFYWIMEWEEYLEIVQSLATKRPQFMYSITAIFGPFDSQEEADKERVRVQQEIFELVYQDELGEINSGTYQEDTQ